MKAQIVTDYLHTALRVRDLEGALHFYKEIVGLAESRRGGDPAKPGSVWLEGLQLVRAEAQDTAEKGVLDHIGFDVKDLKAFITKIEREGIKLDEPYRETPTGNAITYITDAWGTRIELIKRGPVPVL